MFDVPATGKQRSSWSSMGLVRYALRSISSFSALPMQLVTLCGAITFLLSLLVGGIAIYDKITGQALDGFTTVILLILMIGSILMLSLGLIGNYLARIFEEVKMRPIWLADERNSKVNLK